MTEKEQKIECFIRRCAAMMDKLDELEKETGFSRENIFMYRVMDFIIEAEGFFDLYKTIFFPAPEKEEE